MLPIFFGYLGSLAMGFVLGLIGGGGSIMAIPILVYLFGIEPTLAITYSLFIVGFTSLFASVNHIRYQNFCLDTALLFGSSSVVSVVLMRWLVVPLLPKVLFCVNGFCVTKSMFLLVLFAGLMFLSAYKMLTNTALNPKEDLKPHLFFLMASGFGVGCITGLIGAGGGFLIVPSLVVFAQLDIKKAIGTSLLIIGVNTLIGFGISVFGTGLALDWRLLLGFLSVSVVGSFLGTRLVKYISDKKLKPIFAYFLLIMASYILIKELF